MKVSEHTTYNIQGVKQRDPSVLHDSAGGKIRSGPLVGKVAT